MTKTSPILTVAVVLAAAAFTSPLAKAQLQFPGDGISIQQTRIGLTKGEYQTFNLAAATGVTATTTGTTSGTISSMNVSMQGLIATVTTTVKYRSTEGNKLGVDAASFFGGPTENFFTEIKQGKKDPTQRQTTGFGFVPIYIQAAVSTYSKSLIAGVTNLSIYAATWGTTKETVWQNQTNGVVINSLNGTYNSKSSAGDTQPLP